MRTIRMHLAIRSAAVLAAAILLFTFGCVPEPENEYARGDIPDAAREIFVLNSLAESVTIIHPDAVAAGADDEECVYNNVFLAGRSPNHISHFGGRLWIVNSLDNTLTFYDEDTLEEGGKIHLDRGSNPWQLVMNGEETIGYIPCYVSGTVLRIDLSAYPDSSTEAPEAEIFASDLALPEGAGLCQNTAGRELLFVVNSNNSAAAIGPGSLSVIDTASGAVTAVDLEPAGFNPETDRGRNPQAVLVFPSLGEVHVVCTGDHPGSGHDSDDGEIVVVDIDSLAVTDRIAIGGSPNGFPAGVDPAGHRVFLANNESGITVYDYATREVIRGTEDPVLPEGTVTDSYYTGVLYDAATDLLFVSDFSGDAVHVVEGSGAFSFIRTLEGSDGPGFLLLVEE